MNKLKHLLATLALFPALAFAQVQVLGFEIGSTTSQQLKTKLASQTRVEDNGTNKFSGGRQFKTDGTGYGIDTLTEVVYIFDPQDKLAGVLMGMGKDRFDDVFNALSAKYKVSSQQRPFVGNKSARFNAKGAVIELDAPHMSFTMSARYIREDLMKKFLTESQAETQQKKAAERSQF